MISIQRVLVRHGLDDIITATHFLRPLRFLFYLFPRAKDVSEPLGKRIRLALIELGPIFVKFGQAVSTRRDLLPPDIADELAMLQDRVPPFPADEAIAILDHAYGKSVDEIFSRFDKEPFAAASIAQVHTAALQDGTEVIVKLLRPGVRELIDRDLDVLYAIAGLADRYWETGKRLRPLEVVAEYEKTIIDELDLAREGANTAQLKRNFEGSELLYVPDVYWDYCRPEVLVQERIYGTQISDMDTLKKSGVNIQVLAENGVEIFFTQVFRHNFFHADMHPGNIFVLTDDPEKPKYAAVDFGIVGTLSPSDQQYLAGNFLAFFDRDYHRIAKLHIDSGWVPPETRIDELESAVRSVCEPIFNKPLSEISFAQVMIRLFETARRFNMEIQPQLILLQKTLFNIEGLGRELYPQLDLWKTAHPILRQWMADQMGGRAALNRLKEDLPQIRDALRDLPGIVRYLSEQITNDNLHFDIRAPELEDIRKQLKAQQKQRYFLATGATAFVSGVLILTFGSTGWLGWTLIGAGVLAAFAGRPQD
jgi:ubiquinone biosynthesis protein